MKEVKDNLKAVLKGEIDTFDSLALDDEARPKMLKDISIETNSFIKLIECEQEEARKNSQLELEHKKADNEAARMELEGKRLDIQKDSIELESKKIDRLIEDENRRFQLEMAREQNEAKRISLEESRLTAELKDHKKDRIKDYVGIGVKVGIAGLYFTLWMLTAKLEYVDMGRETAKMSELKKKLAQDVKVRE